MVHVFLSASVPLPERDEKYFKTADVIAIREAVKSLIEVVLPTGKITCGGHPAITPLILLFVREACLDTNRVTIFQSELYEKFMPADTREFSDLRIVPKVGDEKEPSLTAMRQAMVNSERFDAAVFIGGMEGLFEELELFRGANPNALLMPLASTGAAAQVIFQHGLYPDAYRDDMTYSSLFRRKLLPLHQGKQ